MWDEVAWSKTLVPTHLQHVAAYEPGKPIEELERELGIAGAVKLASNENPLGPSQLAQNAVAAAIPTLHLYPDAGAYALRRAIASRFGVGLERVVVGPGSNDLLYQLVLGLCAPGDEVVSHAHAFLSYRLAAQVAGHRFVEAAAGKQCNIGALIAALTDRTKLVFLGTPNNPTGSVLQAADIERVLEALPSRAVLVIDEAYIEYAAAWPERTPVQGATFLTDPRVMILRTFSKIYGLAGARVGFGIGHAEVIKALSRVTRTFSVGSLAQVAAIAALGDDHHVRRSAENARHSVERLTAELGQIGVDVTPSCANFVLADFGRPTASIYDMLLHQGVIVRPMGGWGLPTCLRISAAVPEDLERCVRALRALVTA